MRQSLAAAIAAALVLVGCGSGGTKTVTVTSTSSSVSSSSLTTVDSSATSETTPTSTSSATSSTTTSVTGVTVSIATFKSPTGNIGCMIVAGTARCDIRKRRWSPPRRPASCPNIVDFGQGLIVGRSGVARFVCAGDTSMDPSARPLAYNKDTLVDGFQCDSTASGMSCTNLQTRHGFFISIQGYRIF